FLWEVAASIGSERAARSRAVLARLLDEPEGAAAAAKACQQWTGVLGQVQPSPTAVYAVRPLPKPVVNEVGERGNGLGFYYLLPPVNATKNKKYPVVVAFAQAGMKALVKDRAETVAALLKNGIAVCLTELRGLGVTGSRGRTSPGIALSATELMLGETVIGQQLRELRELIAHLRKHADIDGGRIALWGDSLARVNPPDRLLEVPLDADSLPDLAEPGCSLLALL